METETVELEAVFLRASDSKAVLVAVGRQQCWIPESQIGDESEIFAKCDRGKGEICKLVCTRWIAEEKGLVPREDPDDE